MPGTQFQTQGFIENPQALADLSGKVAFVTGASSGLGERFALLLAHCGASVAVAARRADRLESLVRAIEAAGGKAVAIPLDVGDEAAILPAIEQAEAALGPIDILINNAGVANGRRAVKASLEGVNASIDINLKGPWLLACEVARRLIARDAPGRMINIASMSPFVCSKPGSALYSITKAALVRMTEVLAVEWAPHFINVNAIAPATFESEMTAGAGLLENEAYIQSLPRKRVCSPGHMDSTVLYLLSPLSEAVTGTVIKIDDGQMSR